MEMRTTMTSVVHKPRIAVSEAAILRGERIEDIACTIVDVSSDGFRLTVPRGIPCGGGYRLSYGGEEHGVVIRWASLGEAGGQFLD